jgi:hypothetical protein
MEPISTTIAAVSLGGKVVSGFKSVLGVFGIGGDSGPSSGETLRANQLQNMLLLLAGRTANPATITSMIGEINAGKWSVIVSNPSAAASKLGDLIAGKSKTYFDASAYHFTSDADLVQVMAFLEKYAHLGEFNTSYTELKNNALGVTAAASNYTYQPTVLETVTGAAKEAILDRASTAAADTITSAQSTEFGQRVQAKVAANTVTDFVSKNSGAIVAVVAVALFVLYFSRSK